MYRFWKNKRKSQRIPIVALCDVILSSEGEVKGRGCLVNCSMGGVAIVTSVEIDPGKEVLIIIDILKEKIHIPGVIVYTKKIMGDLYIYGIKCIKLNIFKKWIIRRKLIKHFKSQSYYLK